MGDLKGSDNVHKNVGPLNHNFPFFSSWAVAPREAISAGFSTELT